MAKECSNTSCTKESCEGCSQKKVDFRVAPNEYTHVKHVIGIVSGKGGVGKSSVTACLAVELNRQGYRVGILDADITGPSIPRMFGVKTLGGVQNELMIPGISETDIRLVSVNLLMEEEETPVIWRGPAIAGVVKQFWSDVIWGELDYLLVDMPPGTGDVPLTVFQSLPVDGILLVTSPQSLVEMVVKKAYHMAEQMNIPILGVVENFSYVACPDCGKKIYVFGENKLDEWSAQTGIPICASLPMDPELARMADEGRIEMYMGADIESVASVLPK
ncbi:MAG: Mrp/NBP35 family ATP-binding protein [Clostridiales bacterium]|nr:Mrp/NBP35 family ATP-binding protein [Clostridiales bacterium]